VDMGAYGVDARTTGRGAVRARRARDGGGAPHLDTTRDGDRLVFEVADMRQRIAAQHRRPPIWEAKHQRAASSTSSSSRSICSSARRRSAAGVAAEHRRSARDARGGRRLDPAAADALEAALRLWATCKVSSSSPWKNLSTRRRRPALREILARGAGAIDFDHSKQNEAPRRRGSKRSSRSWSSNPPPPRDIAWDRPRPA